MSISVVIPAYKAAATIERAVTSVLQQTLPPNQILVVDDGSPDGDTLAEVLAKFGTAVTLLKKANGGASSARNYGIDHASCDWVAFLDADDYWERDKLEKQSSVAQNNPEVSLVGCRWYTETPGQPRTREGVIATFPYDQVLRTQGRQTFDLACSVWTGSVFVRRAALASERFITGLEPAEDRDLWIRLLSVNSIYILADVLATYVQEPGGISRSNIDRDSLSMLEVMKRHAHLLGPSGLRYWKANIYRRWAASYLARGQFSKALPHSLHRLALEPTALESWWIVFKSAVSWAFKGNSPLLAGPGQQS